MTGKLVSVCIPCHNAAPYVSQAIESILAQSWHAIEIIVVDDNSIDGSSQVLFTPEATLYYRSGLQSSLSGQKSRKAVESSFHSLLKGTAHLLERRSDPQARLSCANVLQGFIYNVYPQHADLRKRMSHCIKDLGGSDLPPPGGPRFQQLRRLIGWKLAKRFQRIGRS